MAGPATCPCGVPVGGVGFEHRDDCPLRSRYFIFITKATGQQVEWCDEFCEWLIAGGKGQPARVGSDEVEMVRVELTAGRRPLTTDDSGYPEEVYTDWSTP